MLKIDPNNLVTVPTSQRGVALVLVLVAVATAFILSLSFMNAQSTSAGIAANVVNQSNARHIAESAIGIAIENIRSNTNFRTEFTNGVWVTNQSYAGGTFTIFGEDGEDTNGDGIVDGDGDLADDPDDLVTITAVATYKGATHKVRAIVRPGSTTPPIKLLMVINDASAPSANDDEVKTILEGFGYTVTLIDDDANQADYDAALNEHVVVYVTAAANDLALGSKLNNSAIGVVTALRGTYDAFGLSTGNGTFNGTSVNIVNNEHFITSPFTVGSLTITSSSATLTNQSGTVAPGGNPLAVTTSSARALTAIDLGAADYALDPSPGRRVALPWGGSAFDINLLNADGLTMLERSLIWAAAPTTPKSNQVGLVARDQVDVRDDGLIDSFDSRQGPYGGANVGQAAVIVTSSISASKISVQMNGTLKGSTYCGPGGNPSTVITTSGSGVITGARSALNEVIEFPDPPLPTGMPASLGTVTYSGSTVETISSDRRYNELHIIDNAIVNISGDVTFLIDGRIDIENNAEIRLLAGAKLTIYITGGSGGHALHMDGTAKLNVNSADPSRCTVYVMSDGEFDLDGAASGYARFVSKDGELDVNDDCHFYGAFLCHHIMVEQRGQLHHDIGISPFPGDEVAPDEDPEETGPQLVALYEFDNVARPAPTLIHHWKLDEEGSGGSAEPGSFAGGARLRVMENGQVRGWNGRPIAVSVNSTSAERMIVDTDGVVEGDAYVGVGGNPNTVIDGAEEITGSKSALTTAIEFPAITVPDIGASVGDRNYSSGTTTLTADLRVNDLTVQNDAILRIEGDVTIVVDDDLRFYNTAQLVIADGGSLTVYVADDFLATNATQINTASTDPNRLLINHHATDGPFMVNVNAIVYATVYSINEEVAIRGSSQFFGTVVAHSILVHDNAVVNVAGGSNATDEIGSADGSFEEVTLGVTGHDGTAAQFNGTSSHVVIPHTDVMLLNEGSVAFWFNSSRLNAKRGLFSKDSADYDNGGHLHIFTNGNKLKAQLDTDGSDPFGNGNDFEVVSSTNLTTNTWYHATVTWGPHGLRLFLDGSLEDTEEYIGGTGTTSGGSGNTEPIVLGASATGSGDGSATPVNDFFEGLIDDVRIYDIALSPSQANNLANDTALGNSDDPGLVLRDTSNFGAALDLTIERGYNIEFNSDGLTLAGDNRIVSDAVASKVHTALTATNQMSVEIQVSTDDLGQFGPANIVTYSSGVSIRNFTLGQVDTSFLGRVRTTDTVANGTPDVSSPSGMLAEDTSTHVIMSYNGENVTLYINGVAKASVPRTGDFDDWASTMKLMLANEFSTDRPWHGTFRRVAIWDTGFNSRQARNVFNGEEPGDGTSNDAFKVTWVEIP